MKIVVDVSESKYKALQRCEEAGMELGVEQRAVLDGVVLSDDLEPMQLREIMSNFYDALTACYHVISYDEEGYIRDAEDLDKYNFMYFFEDWYNHYPWKTGDIE